MAAEQKAMYADEYQALADLLLAFPVMIQPLETFLIARKAGAAQTLLNEALEMPAIQAIRGKAAFMAELLVLCQAVKAQLDNREPEHHG
jgi:hypothetical protein